MEPASPPDYETGREAYRRIVTSKGSWPPPPAQRPGYECGFPPAENDAVSACTGDKPNSGPAGA